MKRFASSLATALVFFTGILVYFFGQEYICRTMLGLRGDSYFFATVIMDLTLIAVAVICVLNRPIRSALKHSAFQMRFHKEL